MAFSALRDLDTGPTGTEVQSALVVTNPDREAWDEECDLLVIGCGLAGATTALKAAESSALSVVIADRFQGGGASQASGGVLYLGGGTAAQKEAGVTDSPEAMAEYLAFEAGNVVSRETLVRFCKTSASFIPWLGKYGVRFGGPMTEAKTAYPTTDFLYYSGNERLDECKQMAKPAPRGHRTKASDGSDRSDALSGGELMGPLKTAIDRSSNITFRRQTAARRLILDPSGQVVGAEFLRLTPGSFAAGLHDRLFGLSSHMGLALLGLTRPFLSALRRIERRSARPWRVRARKGTVLASGGFIYNRRMLAENSPSYANLPPLGTIGDDGSGIMLGQSAGAAVDRMERSSAWRFLYPPATWVKGTLVSRTGERIANEESYGSRIGEAVFERGGGHGWIILDSPLFEEAKKEAANPALVPAYLKIPLRAAHRRYAKTAATIEALAGKIGIDPKRLSATITKINGDIAAGRPDALGKSAKLCRPIRTAPFTAIDLSWDTTFNPPTGITVGGLRVNEDTGAVLNDEYKPISGLYAAGRTAVGLCSHYYVSGLSLADCVFSGLRVADSVAADEAKAEPNILGSFTEA